MEERSPLNAAQIEAVFAKCFQSTYNTILVGGAQEPLYQPNDSEADCHVIYYRADYAASALHEAAHWCIAGEHRRQLIDYGYWYVPDGRNNQQQRQFEQCELKPQALECAFSHAAGLAFRVSIDNINTSLSSEQSYAQERAFSAKVKRQLEQFVNNGFPTRAALFIRELQAK